MNLTTKDRVTYSFLLRILEKVDPNNIAFYSSCKRIVEKGFSMHYSLLHHDLSREVSIDQCKFVHDVIEMYEDLYFSAQSHFIDSPSVINNLKFRGFSQSESHMQLYANYILDDSDYEDLSVFHNESTIYNTSDMTPKYTSMLKLWKKYFSGEKGSLSLVELKEILNTV